MGVDPGTSRIDAVAVAPDSSAVAAAFSSPLGARGPAGADRSVIVLWAVKTQQQRRVIEGLEGMVVTALEFSRDAKLLAGAVGTTGPLLVSEVILWDASNGRRTTSLGRSKGRLFRCLSFSPDGTLLAAGDTLGSIWLWAPRAGGGD
jgi:WD40 repeat protein